MSDDLDLRSIDHRHEPDPQFRAALHRRLVAIIEGTDPTDVAEPADITTFDLDQVSRRAERSRRNRWIARGAVAIASAAAIVALVMTVSSRDDGTSPADVPSVSTSIYDGWVTFAASDGDPEGDGYPDEDVYVVREGSPPRRLAGSDTDELVQVCPAFSPDRSQLLFGQAAGSEADAYRNAALVITDVTADGELSQVATVPLGGEIPPPCGIWSADGRWVAFGVDAPLVQEPEDADGMNPREPTVHSVDEVWVVDTESDDIRRLTGLFVTDLEWSPGEPELALIGDGVSLYSVATDEIRPLGGAGTGQRIDWTANLDWSPDGRTIAFSRPHPGRSDPFPYDLWLMDADGTNERVLVAEISANHGIGPVWSPDGERIVYQRLCDFNDLGQVCREEHEAVLVTVNQNDGTQPATQVVLPPPETTGPSGPTSWYPFAVTWSPDGTALHYFAWGNGRNAILAVPVDGSTPPIVLSGDLTV